MIAGSGQGGHDHATGYFRRGAGGGGLPGRGMVNGPGIRWAQSRLLDYMGLKDGGEIASIDLPPASSGSADPQHLAGAPTVTELSPRIAVAGTESASKLNDSRKLDNTPGLKGNAEAGSVARAMSATASRTEMQGSPPPLPVPTAVPEPEAPRPSNSHDQSDPARRPGPGTDAGASSATRSAQNQRWGRIPVPPHPYHLQSSRRATRDQAARHMSNPMGLRPLGHLRLPWIRASAPHSLPLCLRPRRLSLAQQTGPRQTPSN